MRLEAYSTSGMRKENQDSYLAVELNVDGKDIVVMVVCDGMGGTSDGAYASNILISRIEEAISEGYFRSNTIDEIAMATHKELSVRSKENNTGSTLTYLWTDGREYEIYHIGDSRCYIQKGTKFVQITEDHSVREDAKRGFFGADSEKYLNYPTNYLSRCVGVGISPIPFIKKGVLTNESGFMLCSDGFWHTFNPEESLGDLKEACDNAIFNGENDNITVLRYLR